MTACNTGTAWNSSGLARYPVLEPETVPAHDFACLLGCFGQDIEKSTHPLASEEDPAAVVIGLDGILDAGFRQRGFESQSFLELLGNVDQIHFLIAEEGRLAPHVGSILSRSRLPPRR